MEKKAYKKPLVRMVNYCYDEQVVAASQPCDQGWTKMTTSKPKMKTVDCDRCFSDMIWINQKSW